MSWVEGNPRVLGGEVADGRILFTKIPYDPDSWLKETGPVRRRYLYCHCPLARQSLKDGGAGIDADWCRCSAGFVKRRFDVAFGEETEATVVTSVLAGDDVCTFAVSLPAGGPDHA